MMLPSSSSFTLKGPSKPAFCSSNRMSRVDSSLSSDLYVSFAHNDLRDQMTSLNGTLTLFRDIFRACVTSTPPPRHKETPQDGEDITAAFHLLVTTTVPIRHLIASYSLVPVAVINFLLRNSSNARLSLQTGCCGHGAMEARHSSLCLSFSN